MCALVWPFGVLVLVCVASAWLQWALGLLDFWGDAWLVSLYLGLFLLAVPTGRALAAGDEGARWQAALLLAVLAAALISVGMVLLIRNQTS